MSKKAIIIGAGPAGLTAAYELLQRTDVKPIILEKSGDIGGISKTVNYKGNRIDIGGHRFFSKSDRVMNWWLNMMPVQKDDNTPFDISYQNKTRKVNIQKDAGNAERDKDLVMLIRKRLSRIYFLRKFFTYPIQLSFDTLSKLGLWTTITIMCSYLWAQLFPRRPEKNLEDFMINRFGKVLYRLFFKDYTEKVWGISCDSISAEWGAQRIKGVSISKAIQHAVQSAMKKKEKRNNTDIAQKDTETSLIEQFLYPKHGPGQLWEEVARQVQEMGGEILMHHDVKRIYTSGNKEKVTAIAAVNNVTGETSYLEGDYFFSTMPIQELIGGWDSPLPEDVKEVAAGLQYRDFITVGILLENLSFQDKKTGEWKALNLKDTWIYIQEKDVKVGRLQLFNNWSPYMVKDPDTTWVGMEFFCNQTDDFWSMPDEAIKQLAIQELEKIGLASSANVLDATVLRMEKTYPAYFGSYDQFDLVRDYMDRFPNLFLVGRNGMHKYNNSDHSMLTAMTAVDNIAAGITSKENIWAINTEQEYHEEKHRVSSDVELPQTAMNLLESERLSSFKNFVFRNPANELFVWTAVIGIIVQLVLFKFVYPFAGFINGDSYVYIKAAYENFSFNTYPIGYSKFLRLFSVFSTWDTALVTFQYLLLQVSIQAFVFSVFYFFRPARWTKILLFGCMLFNPVLLYVANYVSSDALFISLSFIWFTLILWMISQPFRYIMIWHAVVLFLAFTVRYNTLFYPVIALIAIYLSPHRLKGKLSGLILIVLLIGGFILFTGSKYKAYVGKWQFSPFSGWQIVNNCLYAYRFVDSADAKPIPARFIGVDQLVRGYFDSTAKRKDVNSPEWKVSTVYMWDPISPLQRYKESLFKKDSTAGDVKKWATVAPLYKDYGTYLIKTYPGLFVSKYLIPNAVRYYAPPVEFLGEYSTGVDTVHAYAQMWFGYKSNKLRTYYKDYKVYTLDFYPVLVGSINIVFLMGLVCFYVLKGYRQHPSYNRIFFIGFSLWLTNFSFSILASPIALRFQLFPLLVFMGFSFILVEYLATAAKGLEIKSVPTVDRMEGLQANKTVLNG